MTTQQLANPSDLTAAAIERALVHNDLSQLTAEQRLEYYQSVCQSVGLNALTRPFEYITLNNKLTLYAKPDCTDQLRKIHCVSISIIGRVTEDGIHIVTAQAKMKDGRQDESVGAVAIDRLQGESKANAMMKAETKAKRRVTLSICGLGMLTEDEVEGAEIDPATGFLVKTFPEDKPRVDHLAEQKEHVKTLIEGKASSEWETVVCHIGNADGPILMKTVGEICGPSVPLKKAQTMLDWFESNIIPSIATSTKREDVALIAALKSAREAFTERVKNEAQNPVSAPVTPPDPSKRALDPKESQETGTDELDKRFGELWDRLTPEQKESMAKAYNVPGAWDKEKATLERELADLKEADKPSLFAPDPEPVPVEVTKDPAPTKRAKPARDKDKGLDWRNVKIPFKCKIEGERLGNIPPMGGLSWVETFEAIPSQLFRAEYIKSCPMADYNRIQAAYAIAKEELCIGHDDRLPKKLKDLAEDLAVSTEGLIEHAWKMGLISSISPQSEKLPTIWEKIHPDDLRNLIRNWPDFAQNVKDNFNIQPKK